jgi:transcriptional regulator with XRE-family HTH domain
MTIGTRIKTLRKAEKLSQGELAKKIGVAQSLIAYLESGNGTGTTHIASIARALNVDAHWLETGEGSQTLNFTRPTEITKTYRKEIEEVIKLMEAADDRGCQKALIAVMDALDAHRAWKNSLPRPQDADELGELSSRLVRDLLPESVESENVSNDVYRAENGAARKDKRH